MAELDLRRWRFGRRVGQPGLFVMDCPHCQTGTVYCRVQAVGESVDVDIWTEGCARHVSCIDDAERRQIAGASRKWFAELRGEAEDASV